MLALWQSHQVRQEVTALFDAHIAESAKLLEALVRSESLEYPPGKGPPPDFDRFVAAELKLHLSLPAYAQDHAYQISFGAPRRRLQSATAPSVALAPDGQSGFSQTAIKGAVWRVFTLRGQGGNGEVVVSVGEPLAVRAQVVRRDSYGLGVPGAAAIAMPRMNVEPLIHFTCELLYLSSRMVRHTEFTRPSLGILASEH